MLILAEVQRGGQPTSMDPMARGHFTPLIIAHPQQEEGLVNKMDTLSDALKIEIFIIY